MEIQALVDKYKEIYPDEIKDLRLLSDQLSKTDNITHRKNFVGHVTASAFVINEHTKQVLLLEHKSLMKLLQPGGHIEPDDNSLLASVLREVEEETGLKAEDLKLRPIFLRNKEVPFDIDTHYIPENLKKGELGHYHHDFRYIYTTKSNKIEIDQTESNNYRWVDWNQFAEISNFTKISQKIEKILEPSPQEFFSSLTNDDGRDVAIVAVSHIIPSSEAYILSLQENFNLVGIIPKPKSIDQHTLKFLKAKGVPILDKFSREHLTERPDILIDLLQPYERICLLDMGGYFNSSMDKLKSRLGTKLLGVIEDTENGHQKYEKNLSGKYTVISVARSPLKDFEDKLVGHSVAHAAETLLRQINVLITYKNCGIIGYGKIGRGVAEYLQQRNIKPIVSELNPMRAVQATCDGMILSPTKDLLRNSDVIFCATGARALDLLKFRDIKKGAFVASVTSSDDEFNLSFVESEYQIQDVSKHITKYSKHGHNFYLLNNGNAINFLFAAAVDKYITLVQGELIFSINKLIYLKQRPQKTIMLNSNEERENIARLWLDTFQSSNN